VLAERLFDDVGEAPASPIWWALGLALLALVLVALTAYLEAEARGVGVERRWLALLAGFGALGLANLAFAALTVPLLSRRIWLVLALLGLVGVLAQGTRALWWRRPSRPKPPRPGDEAEGASREQTE
jgi:hypothetical protein